MVWGILPHIRSYLGQSIMQATLWIKIHRFNMSRFPLLSYSLKLPVGNFMKIFLCKNIIIILYLQFIIPIRCVNKNMKKGLFSPMKIMNYTVYMIVFIKY